MNEEKIPSKKELNLNKDYLTVKEAEAYLSLSHGGFLRLRKEWNIPCSKVPGMKIMFRRIDLERLIEQFMNAPKDMFPPHFKRYR